MIALPIGIIWLGYTLAYYGISSLKGPGIGFTDLIIPSRISKVDGVIKTWTASAISAAPTPDQQIANSPPGQGLNQPGSSLFPKSPSGGLPSKPPLGPTPPAYYG